MEICFIGCQPKEYRLHDTFTGESEEIDAVFFLPDGGGVGVSVLEAIQSAHLVVIDMAGAGHWLECVIGLVMEAEAEVVCVGNPGDIHNYDASNAGRLFPEVFGGDIIWGNCAASVVTEHLGREAWPYQCVCAEEGSSPSYIPF